MPGTLLVLKELLIVLLLKLLTQANSSTINLVRPGMCDGTEQAQDTDRNEASCKRRAKQTGRCRQRIFHGHLPSSPCIGETL